MLGRIGFIICIISLLGCTTTVNGGDMKVEQIVLNNVEKEFIASQFKIIMKREDIRNDVIFKLSPKGIPIANPGEKYNTTDVIDSNYPTKMILFAGESDNLVFVHYMQGGFAPHSALYLAKFNNNEIIFECGYFLPRANSIEELRNIFQSKAQRDKNSCTGEM